MTTKVVSKAAVLLGMAMTAGSALAQPIPAYSPGASYDQMSWQAFVSVVTPAGGGQGLTLETWATDADTYQATPTWPAGLTAAAVAERPRFQTSLLARAHLPVGLRANAGVSVGGVWLSGGGCGCR